METVAEKIIRKTGAKPNSCKCAACKTACTRAPGLATPEDIQKLIAAGYEHKLKATLWLTGVVAGLHDKPIEMTAPLFENGQCAFYEKGLCELHDKGLKPLECKLSNHTVRETNTNPKKSLSWNIAKEWIKLHL